MNICECRQTLFIWDENRQIDSCSDYAYFSYEIHNNFSRFLWFNIWRWWLSKGSLIFKWFICVGIFLRSNEINMNRYHFFFCICVCGRDQHNTSSVTPFSILLKFNIKCRFYTLLKWENKYSIIMEKRGLANVQRQTNRIDTCPILN